MSRINLTDDDDMIANKIRKAKTDPEPLPETLNDLSDRPEADNLVGIYAALSGTTKQRVIADHAGAPFAKFKPALADLAVSKIGPIGQEMRRLLRDPAEIDRMLCDGADRAREIARPVVDEVKDILGFVRSTR